MNIKPILLFLLAFVAMVSLVGCGQKQTETDIHFSVEQNAFEVTSWKNDDSHNKIIKGKLTVGDKPVGKADILYDNKKVIQTATDGSFSFLINQTVLSHKQLVVQSADNALLDGKAMNKSLQDALKKQAIDLDVYYPISILNTETNGEKVSVQARLKAPKNNNYHTVELDKYIAKGVVKDANGTPVSGAIVSIIEDELEGWARSKPSNDKGEYILKFMSEDANRMIRVSVGDKQYKLPAERRIQFPEETSVHVDITLPNEGFVITDKPPFLISQTMNGAVYSGIIPGINAPKESYEMTVPALDGTFHFTIDKKVWDSHPTFYETYVEAYTTENVEFGKAIPKELVKDPLPSEPKNIQVEAKS